VVVGEAELDCQSLPFGDQLNCFPDPKAPNDNPDEDATGSMTGIHFTGKERDSESGNDYFGARYYASSMGRFLSPDDVIITPERLMNPQQLNLYAYVANNPLRFIDPTGEILQCVGDAKSQSQCFSDLQQIAGDAANRLSMDAKTGVVSFDTKDSCVS
jgi:RHS repeat-associated protein